MKKELNKYRNRWTNLTDECKLKKKRNLINTNKQFGITKNYLNSTQFINIVNFMPV